MHADPKDTTNILNRQYESVYTKEDTNNVPSPSGQPYHPMEEITVTEHGVGKLLLKSNPRKACGPDMISARILKDLAVELAPLLTAIYQKFFDCEEVRRTGDQQISHQYLRREADLKQATTIQYH